MVVKELVMSDRERTSMSSKIIAMNEQMSFKAEPERHKSLRSKEKIDCNLTRHKPFRMRKHSHRSNADQKSHMHTEISDLAPYMDPNATAIEGRFSNISATL